MSLTQINFEINAISLALATVIVRHRHITVDETKQYSVVDLVSEVNSFPFNEIIRIHDIAILQQGLYEFKRVLNKSYLHLELIPQQRKGELLTLAFGALEGHQVAYDVKFVSYYSKTENSNIGTSCQLLHPEIEIKIKECYNDLLTKFYKVKTLLHYSFEQVRDLYSSFQIKPAPQAGFTQQPIKEWLEPKSQI